MRKAFMLYPVRILKNSVLVFLLLALLMPLLVSLLVLIQQQFIRYEMLEQLEAKNLTTITIKKNSVKWIRKNKEIELDGKLFDVKEIAEKGNSYLIKGLFDEKETILLLTLKKAQQAQGNKPIQQVFLKLFSGTLFFEPKNELHHKLEISLSRKYHLYNTDDLLSWCPALTGPPPKFS